MIDNEKWDMELEQFINKAPIPSEPEIPFELQFPFLVIFYRKKITLRNQNYLLAVPIFSLTDYVICKRSLTHKGWPISAMIMDLPENMKDDHLNNRYIYYKFYDWTSLQRILSDDDKKLIPQLAELYPCQMVHLKEKDGQIKFIL